MYTCTAIVVIFRVQTAKSLTCQARNNSKYKGCSESAELGYTSLMDKQVLVIVTECLSGHDVFPALRTDYGKSLCYCLPQVFDKLQQDKLRQTEGQVVIVISPLVSLMKDQIALFRRGEFLLPV